MVHLQSEKRISLFCNYNGTLSAESLNRNAVLHVSSRSAVLNSPAIHCSHPQYARPSPDNNIP
jgi:hypothetical protein